MFEKLIFWRKLNRLGLWTVPLVSVTSLMPIFAGQWLFSDSSSNKPKPSPTSPAASTSLTSPTYLASPTPSTLKPPKPKVTNNQPPAAPSASEPKPAKPTPKQSVKTAAASPPQAAPAPPIAPLAAAPSYRPPQIEIKVAILRKAPGTTLGVSQTASVTDSNGKALQTLAANQGIWVQPNGSSLSLGNSQLPQAVWIQPNQGGLVHIGDRWYRGKVLLVSQGSTLLAVNYVDFEQYLYSVVGSEMHANAPMEALKAQAVAARSYALVHMIRPASSWYHLGNTQRWQVYKGLKSEYNTSQHAVDETAGQILSHKGGVVESLYAATDEIVSRAHGGRGMSQTGAYGLAKDGYDYQAILNHYYPGVALARLVLQ